MYCYCLEGTLAGQDINDGGAPGLHNDENWQARLEEARLRRAKALREKERLKQVAGNTDARVKPWDAEAEAAKPLAPIVREQDLPPRDDLDFADRVEAIRQTAQNAPHSDNDATVSSDDDVAEVGLVEEAFLEEAASTLQPVDAGEETPDADEVLVLSERYAEALDAFENTTASPENSIDDIVEAVDAETADRFARTLASIEADDVVVDLSERYAASGPDLSLYPGADAELAKRYATALAAISQSTEEKSVAGGARRIFLLSSLVLVVGFLTVPLLPVQSPEVDLPVLNAPTPGLQPSFGVQQSLQDTFAMAVPLIPRVAPGAPEMPGVAQPVEVVPTPDVLAVPGEAEAFVSVVSAEAPWQTVRKATILHDPLSADRTFVAGLSPDITAPAAAIVRPERLVRKLPEFPHVGTEVRPSQLDDTNIAPIYGTITVTALQTEDAFDALANAIAADVARSLRR